MKIECLPLPFPAETGEPDRLLIALLRCWASRRRAGINPMPAMLRLVSGHDLDCTLVPACDSFFTLSESCLGRPLMPIGEEQAATGAEQTADEAALLATLRQCPMPENAMMPAGIPHGLPGALCWAAYAVRRALSLEQGLPAMPLQCPFGEAPRLALY